MTIFSIKNTKVNLLSFSVAIFCLFAFSRSSWGLFLPSSFWGILLAFADFLLFLALLKNLNAKQIGLLSLLPIFMLFFMTFRNFELSDTDSYVQYTLIYYSIFFMYYSNISSKTRIWIQSVIDVVFFMSCFYALMTIICNIFPDFYFNIIAPMFKKVGMNDFFITPATGFTITSTNNGLYICLGIFISFYNVLFDDKKNIKKWVIFIIYLIALLMTGKRGLLICLVLTLFIAYSNYSSTQKRGRYFKILLITLLLITVVYIVSLFFPTILYSIEKTKNLKDSGDISNGRLLLWRSAWGNFVDNPVFGYGWRWFKYNGLVSYRMDVHNVYLQLLTEIGLIGSFIFFSFFTVSYKRIYYLSRNIRKNPLIDINFQKDIYFAFMIQTFFLIYMLEGTALYQSEGIIFYLIGCAIGEYYFRKFKKLKFNFKPI